MAGIRMSGLISNMDTESIVKQLMEAQRTKVTKIENKKTKLEWTQDKWKDLNTKLYNLYKEKTSDLRLQGSYSTKKATSSDESVVKVTAGNTVSAGTHSIAIKQLANTQYLTGEKLGSAVTTSSDLSSMGIMEGTVIKINGTKEVDFTVKSSSKLSDFISACKSAGVTASYDAKQQKMYFNAAKSGKDSEFTISSNTSSALVSGVATDAATQSTAKAALAAMNTNKTVLAGFADAASKTAFYNTAKSMTGTDTADSLGLTTEQFEYAKAYKSLYDLTATQATDEDSAQKAAEKLVKDSIRKTINGNLTDNDYGLTGIKTKTGIDADLAAYHAGTLADGDVKNTLDSITALAKADIEAAGETPIDWDTASDELKKQLADKVSGYYVDSIVETASTSSEGTAAIDSAKANQIALAKGYAENNMQGIISGYVSSDGAGFTNDALGAFGISSFTDATRDVDGKIVYAGKGSYIAASDCVATYNGAEVTSNTNTLSVNGLTFEALSKSEKTSDGKYKETTISVASDTDATYKKIKDFLTQYNGILKELNGAYDAKSSRGYEPLTDEEKEVMTDDQIKLWEDKIKDSLLRRDSTLGTLTSAMKSAMSSVVEVNGKRYSLASFGIMTSSDYAEKGLLHIYGDKEDATYSDKDDKLKAAIEADPDAFSEAFSGIVKNLHDTLYKKMSKTSMSSALTFYNDKSMKDQVTSYEKDITKLEKKLTTMESNYYKQFTAMETALAKLQSQQSALSGLLGTSQ